MAVAEYVESDELLRDVQEAGFELGQGYRLHRPAEDLPALVSGVPA